MSACKGESGHAAEIAGGLRLTQRRSGGLTMTSSASATIVGGMSRQRALAVASGD